MRPQRKRRFGYLSLLLLISIAGCFEEPTAPPAEPPKVGVMHPEKRELTDTAEFNGWLGADDTLEVRARVRGHIKKVHFTDGQIVKKGDVLFEIDPRPYQAELDQANGAVLHAEAKLKLAEADVARGKEISKTKGAISQQDLDKFEAARGEADAAVKAAKANTESAKLNLVYAVIPAAIGGRISKAELTEGNLVNAGGSDPLLTTIVALDPIRVHFNVDERFVQRYAKSLGLQGKSLTDMLATLKDRKAPFSFAQDGENEFTHAGVIAFGDNRIDPSTGTLQVYGQAANKDGKYLPGARVRVRVPIGGGKPYAALVVPETAILADQDKRYVLIADDQNATRRRNVTLGKLTDDGMRAIQPADKLAEGEKPDAWWVLVDNIQRARLNYPVDPQKPAPGTEGKKQETEPKKG